jgi:hypothetical protein
MTIQAALAGGVEGEPSRRKLIAQRVKEQDALRRRFKRAKSEGDLPNDVDAADLTRFVTALFQGMTVQAINGASRRICFVFLTRHCGYGQNECGTATQSSN